MRFRPMLHAAILIALGSLAAAECRPDPVQQQIDSLSPPEMLKLEAQASHGDAVAQYVLGRYFLESDAVPHNAVEAARWLHRAADAGYGAAEFRLGYLYGKGEGVPQEQSTAERLFRQAAEHGFAQAQWSLGAISYQAGNYEEALKWLGKAATQGDADAQEMLGSMYEDGDGVPQDYRLAVLWYSRAAEQSEHLPSCGSVEHARSSIGFMYLNGEGLPRDYVEAYKWLSLAGERDNAQSVSEHMTSLQVAEALQRARIWAAKHGEPPPVRTH